MSTGQRTIVKYSICFKQKVVKEIEDEGLSIQESSRRYGIKGGSTVQKWIKKFGKYHLLNKVIRIETMEEKDRIKQLEEENKKLKIALADSLMEKRCLEVVIEEGDKQFNLGLKKKLEELVLGGSKKNMQ
jgi:transposase-like protein